MLMRELNKVRQWSRDSVSAPKVDPTRTRNSHTDIGTPFLEVQNQATGSS